MANNETTLQTYQEHFNNYINKTFSETSGSQKEWIDSILGRVSVDATILEIGSAFGRDAKYIQDAGYDITVTDAFDAAVNELKNRGFAATKLNILTDEPQGEYDLIFAFAVFLHFTEEELRLVLAKLKPHIKDDGLLAFSVKQGDGEEWTSEKMDGPRYFHYWQKEPLTELVQECGYELVEVGNIDDSQKWLAVTCTPATTAL